MRIECMKTFKDFLEDINLQEISRELALKAYLERKERTAAPISRKQDLETGHSQKQLTKSGTLKYTLNKRRMQYKFGV